MDEMECVAAMFDDEDSSCAVEATAGGGFSVAVRTRLEGRGDAVISFDLPPGYPSEAPCRASLRCDAVANAERERLADALRAAAAECPGEEAVLRCIQTLQGFCEENEAGAGAGGAEIPPAASPQPDPAVAAPTIAVRMLWFHHIKSTTKRRFIVEAARSSSLGGFSKPGYPGVVVVEGEESRCDDFVRDLRRLRWKAMALRAELSQPVAPGGDLDAARRFQGLFEELAEDEMGEAAARCRAAGYEEEFCHSVLKVRPTAM